MTRLQELAAAWQTAEPLEASVLTVGAVMFALLLVVSLMDVLSPERRRGRR